MALNKCFGLLLIVTINLQSVNSFKCYLCSGFKIKKDDVGLTNAIDSALAELPKDEVPFPFPMTEKCVAQPDTVLDTVECSSVCLTLLASVNTANYGGPDFGKAEIEQPNSKLELNLTRKLIKEFEHGQVVMRTCLDEVLKFVNEKVGDANLQPEDFPADSACINIEGSVLGANTKGSLCSCTGDHCNNKTPQTLPATVEKVPEIVDSQFTEECPTPYGSYPSEYCYTECNTTISCENHHPSEGRLCCSDGCSTYCKKPLPARNFAAYQCLQAQFSNAEIQKFYNDAKNDINKEVNRDTGDDIKIPPLTDQCLSKPLLKEESCKTISFNIISSFDFRNYNGPFPAPLKDVASSFPFKFDSLRDLGKGDVVFRACLDKFNPQVLRGKFMKLPQTKACGKVSAQIFGATGNVSGCACNSANCNGALTVATNSGGSGSDGGGFGNGETGSNGGEFGNNGGSGSNGGGFGDNNGGGNVVVSGNNVQTINVGRNANKSEQKSETGKKKADTTRINVFLALLITIAVFY